MVPDRPRFDLAMAAALARAVVELALARLRLARRGFDAVGLGSGVDGESIAPSGAALIDRVAFAIPRVAARLPLRADCLVQALAAQRWLGAAGIGSTLHLGAPKALAGRFEAHAWLIAGGRVVTGGGEIDRFVPLRGRSG